MGKVNKSLKAWVSFVKSVQKKYKLSYKDAIHKAKELKDKGADWMNKGLKSMKGGVEGEMEVEESDEIDVKVSPGEGMDAELSSEETDGGRRRRRTRKNRVSRRSRGRSRSRSFRQRMSRRRAASRKASRSMGMVMGVA